MNERTGRLYGSWREILGAIVVLVSRLATLPKTFWEGDELLFAAAVLKFDPWSSRPHPPGYPLYVGLGKFFALFTGDPFEALIALSVIASVIGFVALSIAFRHILQDPDLAVCGALLFYFSASMLVHGTLPLSDGPALMFVALMLWAATAFPDHVTERRAIALGLAASAAIGTRPQLVVSVLPLLLILLLWTRNVRKIIAGLISFGVLSIAWFAPLMDAAGGWSKLLLWETRQAGYVAAHDAAMSRGASTTSVILSRFVAHPWGPKWIALPLALIALFGIFVLARKPKRPLLAVAIFTIIQFVFAIYVMDPADGARYSLPHMVIIALLIAAGLDVIRRSVQLRVAPWIVVVVMATVSLAYTWPIVGTRRLQPSPPAAAAAYANANFPRNTVIAYELSLRPHSEYLMSRFPSIAVEKALAAFYDRPEVPLVLFGDGGSRFPEGKVFAWPESDAYGKLTRNHYRVVSLEPIPPNERYLPLRGVFPLERTVAGDAWRWLSRDAVIRMPSAHLPNVILTLRLSPDSPYDSNAVTIGGTRATVTRQPTTIKIAIPPGPAEIAIHADQAFVPATVLHNQDPRILAVQLIGVVQSP
ncbi:MAG TPA: glycosyltransferase family 39 protein [Thermoanaerobaculia bacterium]